MGVRTSRRSCRDATNVSKPSLSGSAPRASDVGVLGGGVDREEELKLRVFTLTSSHVPGAAAARSD
jgi:hypothetical protein